MNSLGIAGFPPDVASVRSKQSRYRALHCRYTEQKERKKVGCNGTIELVACRLFVQNCGALLFALQGSGESYNTTQKASRVANQNMLGGQQSRFAFKNDADAFEDAPSAVSEAN